MWTDLDSTGCFCLQGQNSQKLLQPFQCVFLAFLAALMTFPSTPFQHCTEKYSFNPPIKIYIYYKVKAKLSTAKIRNTSGPKMCFLQKIFGTEKANNSNNIVRIYWDVIHTGQRDLVYKLSDCQSFYNWLVKRTLKLGGPNNPREHDEGYQMTVHVVSCHIKNDEYK